MYRNPVLDRDFPDPDVFKAGDEYYAYATNGTGSGSEVHVQAARSPDLVHWTPLPDPLPTLPAWAVPDFGWTWAPDVSQTDGRYLMYYTTRLAIKKGGTQCIGLAIAKRPEGPFEPQGDKPFVCQQNLGGSIDPATFVDDDGSHYLLWKLDANSVGGQAAIYIQKLSADGLSLEGEPTRLITAGQVWEGVLVEGPTLWKHDGRYYLFYSANDYASRRYATGYAVADNVLGPYEKAKEPLLATSLPAGVIGPGGQDVVVGPDGNTWIVFHDWSATGYRHLDLARLEWVDGVPAVKLTRDAEPAP
jgi:beta-xylosidase